MKKIKFINILIISLSLLIGLNGCKKELNLTPLDQLSDATFFQSANDYKLFANQYYVWLKNFSTLPGILDNPHSDGRSDLFGGGGSFGAGTNTIPATETTFGNSGNWVIDFSRIRSTNYLITKATSYANQADIAQFVAEARFFRAYVYFD